MDDLRRFGTPITETSSVPVPKPIISTIVGEPTSSMSQAQALKAAQDLAANIPGAAVATLSSAYDGRMAPAIPVNSILVVEPITFPAIRPFDLAIIKAPNGELRARRVLSKLPDRAVAGYEYNGITSMEVSASAFVGRIVAVVLFSPTIVPEKVETPLTTTESSAR